jgi:uncharacterized protein
MLLRRAVALLVCLSAACSRVPEEPSPIVKPVDKTAPTSVTGETNQQTSAKSCPSDPDPSTGLKMFRRATASFVTPDSATHTFNVEVAATPEAQERGLMYRTALAEDAGMVFAFADVHHATFWMRNTCIPLDMIFVSEDKLVIGVVTAPPLNDEPRSVPGLSKYVVELAAGVATKRGIAIGTRFIPPPGS